MLPLKNASEDMIHTGEAVGQSHINPPASGQPHVAAFTHSVQTRANSVNFVHQLLCNPKFLTLLRAIRLGFLTGCPNINENLILKYLNPGPTTAKGHVKRPCHGYKAQHPRQLR